MYPVDDTGLLHRCEHTEGRVPIDRPLRTWPTEGTVLLYFTLHNNERPSNAALYVANIASLRYTRTESPNVERIFHNRQIS